MTPFASPSSTPFAPPQGDDAVLSAEHGEAFQNRHPSSVVQERESPKGPHPARALRTRLPGRARIRGTIDR
eukprot:909170-Prorocentrum_minimum.AAC.1